MKQEEQKCAHALMPAGMISRKILVLLLLLLTGVRVTGSAQNKQQPTMATAKNDEAAIRALADGFVAAFNSGDIDAIMKHYLPGKDFVLFDVVPRKEYLGADAYRKAWVEMFSRFKGRPEIAIADLSISVDGNVGFGHCFMHVTGIDMQGHSVDRWVRVTDGYLKIDGRWLIAHEHISVPVDFASGKLVPISRP